MNNENSVYSFSGGQDSIIFLLLILLQKNKCWIKFLSVNHNAQLNANYLVLQNFYFSYYFHQGFLIIWTNLLSFSTQMITEENFRLLRYFFIVRIVGYYSFDFFLTAHTKSDLVETSLFNFIYLRIPFSHLTFQNKFLKNKFYSKNYRMKRLKTINNEKNTKKQKNHFSFHFSTNRNCSLTFKRPVKNCARIQTFYTLQKINFPVFVDRTNFSFSIFRNLLRRHFCLYLQFSFSKNKPVLEQKASIFQKNNRRLPVYYLLFSKRIWEKTALNSLNFVVMNIFHEYKNEIRINLVVKTNKRVFLFTTKNYICFF